MIAKGGQLSGAFPVAGIFPVGFISFQMREFLPAGWFYFSEETAVRVVLFPSGGGVSAGRGGYSSPCHLDTALIGMSPLPRQTSATRATLSGLRLPSFKRRGIPCSPALF
jgi:hypothetical protein